MAQSEGLSKVLTDAQSAKEATRKKADIKKESLNFSATDFAELEENIEAGGLTPEELEEAKKQREDSVKKLAEGVTKKMQQRAIELSALDYRVLQSMNSEIITLFERSRDRFDKDGEKGLDKGEFDLFSKSMGEKVDKIISIYAPTQEEIKAKEEAEEAFKEAEEAAEGVEEIDLEEVPDDPGEILDLPTLAEKFEYYHQANQTLQKKAHEAMQVAARATQAHATLIDRRNKLEASKKFRQFFGMEDEEMDSLKKLLSNAKEKVEATKEKIEATADKLESYGEKVAEASNEQKRKLMEEERQGHLDRIAGYEKEGTKQSEEEQKRYEQLKTEKEALEANKADLQAYRQTVLEGKEEEMVDRQLYAEQRQLQLQDYGTALMAGRERIDQAISSLDSENLSAEQQAEKNALLLARAKLDEREKGLQLAQTGAGIVLEQNQEAWNTLNEEDRALAEETYNADLHLITVEQDMADIDRHLGVVEAGMVQYTDSREEVETYYANVAETYDGIDDAIDTAITDNNIATTQTLVNLEQQANALGGMKMEKPGWLESTIGVPFATAGALVDLGGDWILKESKDLSQQLREMDKEALGPAYYWSRKIIGTPAVAIFGFTGAGVKVGAGLISVPASWENMSNFGNGLTSMAGLDFKNGRYFGGVGVETWANIIEHSIPYEDFKEGDYALGGGKLFFNLLATAIGGKAAGAGKNAAIKSGQKAMRQAIESGQGALGVIWAGASKGITGGAEAVVMSAGGDVANLARTAASVGKAVAGGVADLTKAAVTAGRRAKGRGVGDEGETRRVGGGEVADEILELADEDVVLVNEEVTSLSSPPKPERTRRGTQLTPEGSRPPQVSYKPTPTPETFTGLRPTKAEAKRPVRKNPEENRIKNLMDDELGAISELEAAQIKGDKKVLMEVFGEHRGNPQKVTEMLGEALNGEENALTPVLENLKQRDPEAYNLIKNTDPEILIDSNCLEPIISGRKKEVVDREGNYITVYEGKPLGKGTVGEVNAVLYHKPGDEGLNYGAYKQQRKYDETEPDPATGRTPMQQLVHEHDEAGFGANEAGIRAAMGKMFEQELNDAQLLQETNNPYLIGVGAIGPDFIIYETVPGAKVVLDIFSEATPEESLALLGDMGKAVEGMHKAGYSHGDIKPENALGWRNGEGELKGVIIDPSANRLENGALATGTPDFFFTPVEVGNFKTKAKAEGKPGLKTEEEINTWAARACDNRALAYSLESSGILDLDPKSANKLGLTPEEISAARMHDPSWSIDWILSLSPEYHKAIGLTPQQLKLLRDTQKLIKDGKNIEIAGSPNYTVRFNSLMKRLEEEAKAYQAGQREVGLFYDPTRLLATEAASSAA